MFGQIYEAGFHIPLAIRWGRHIKQGRVVTDFINVRDFAPTFLSLAGLDLPKSISGQSFLDVLDLLLFADEWLHQFVGRGRR